MWFPAPGLSSIVIFRCPELISGTPRRRLANYVTLCKGTSYKSRLEQLKKISQVINLLQRTNNDATTTLNGRDVKFMRYCKAHFAVPKKVLEIAQLKVFGTLRVCRFIKMFAFKVSFAYNYFITNVTFESRVLSVIKLTSLLMIALTF